MRTQKDILEYEFHCDVCNVIEGPMNKEEAYVVLNQHLFLRHDLDALNAMTGTIPGFEGKSVGVRPIGVDTTILHK